MTSSSPSLSPVQSLALAQYTLAEPVARELARQNSLVKFTFVLFAEDETHGEQVVGTKALQVCAAVPFNEKQTYSVPITDAVVRAKAFASVPAHLLRMTMTVQIGSGGTEFMFDSGPFSLASGNARLCVFKLADSMPTKPGEERTPWVVHALLKKCKATDLVFEEISFTHDPTAHPRLMNAMLREATDDYIDRALQLIERVEPRRVCCAARATDDADTTRKRARDE